MPRVKFSRLQRPSIDVQMGANLMRSLLGVGLPVASSCNGDGICGKCKLRVTPESSLSTPNFEEQLLKEKYALARGERISCQVKILGDIEVDASYW